MQLNSVSNPPADPGMVVIVMSQQGNTVIASSFKYKKGHWYGTSSGARYTTEELGEGPMFWVPCPLQPDYTSSIK